MIVSFLKSHRFRLWVITLVIAAVFLNIGAALTQYVVEEASHPTLDSQGNPPDWYWEYGSLLIYARDISGAILQISTKSFPIVFLLLLPIWLLFRQPSTQTSAPHRFLFWTSSLASFTIAELLLFFVPDGGLSPVKSFATVILQTLDYQPLFRYEDPTRLLIYLVFALIMGLLLTWPLLFARSARIAIVASVLISLPAVLAYTILAGKESYDFLILLSPWISIVAVYFIRERKRDTWTLGAIIGPLTAGILAIGSYIAFLSILLVFVTPIIALPWFIIRALRKRK